MVLRGAELDELGPAALAIVGWVRGDDWRPPAAMRTARPTTISVTLVMMIHRVL